MLALYVFDSTPSEIASSQEWERPGGAAPLFMLRLLFRFGFLLSCLF